jgi:glycosyltransferase involved in cell wall biosynthesis
MNGAARPWSVLRWLQAWEIRHARSRPSTTAPAPAGGRKRLHVDVSVLYRHDAGTGIQRVVRAVANQLVAATSTEWEICFTAATRKRGYRTVAWPPSSPSPAPGPWLDCRPGDVFLGLDFALDTVRLHRRQLAAFKRAGGRIWFVVYDLLPLQYPEWFSSQVVVRYRAWLRRIAALADGFYCISAQVKEDLMAHLAGAFGLRQGFRTEILPMGSDLRASSPTRGLPPGFTAQLQRMARGPMVLLVGTLEPRKGHADVLDAFELLWRQGSDYRLAFVGRPGWKTEQLQERITRHPQHGTRLFWLADASDEALERMYQACTGVIVASHAEGFGLPVIEALAHGKPVLARALPVFLSHQCGRVRHFPAAATPELLAQHIDSWLNAPASANPGAPHPPSWSDTARAIFATLATAPA